MYDIIVVGAGPAGLTAALYARRAEKTVLLIEKSTFGGQITHSPRVENYPGFAVASGTELADKFVEQVLSQGAEIELDCVTSITGKVGDFTVNCENAAFNAKTVIIATGSRHRQLGLAGENDFIGEGISYCAVCDGAFYRDKTVALVGGGNTALQEAVMLSDICSKVIIVQNLDKFTGEQKLVNDVEQKENVETIFSATVTDILHEDAVFKGIEIDANGTKKQLLVDGVFVAIGQQPENEPFCDIVSLDERGYISCDESCVPDASQQGIFVAGDCRTKLIRQVTTATADGATAALAACRLVDALK